MRVRPRHVWTPARRSLKPSTNDSDATVGALDAVQMALTDAQTALSDANTAGAEGQMTVSGLIDDAKTATGDIDDESTPAAVAAGRAAIDAAKESLERDGEPVRFDATAALQGRIDVLESSSSPIEMTVDTNAAKAAAATKRTEIGKEAVERVTADAPMPVSVALVRRPLQTNRLTVHTTWPSSTADLHHSRRRDRRRRCQVHAGQGLRRWRAPCTFAMEFD